MPVTMTENPTNNYDRRDPEFGPTQSFAITPSDTDQLATGTRYLGVLTAGNVKISLVDDPPAHTGVVIALPAGLTKIAVRQVYATSTTATGIVGLY